MNSIQINVSDGTLQTVAIGLQFLDKSHVHLRLSTGSSELVQDTDYTWTNDVTVHLTSPVVAGVSLIVMRRTAVDEVLNLFEGGAPFLRTVMDENFKQFLYAAQEFKETAVITDMYSTLDMHGNAIKNVLSPVDTGDAVNLSYLNAQISALMEVISELGSTGGSGTTLTPYSSTATAGQTVINLSATPVGTPFLIVDGVMQTPTTDYTFDATSIYLVGWSLVAGQTILVLVGA